MATTTRTLRRRLETQRGVGHLLPRTVASPVSSANLVSSSIGALLIFRSAQNFFTPEPPQGSQERGASDVKFR